MRKTLRLALAATSLVTGFLALSGVRLTRQFNRVLQGAFSLTAEDLP